MSSSDSVKNFLHERGVDFDVCAHAPTATSIETARVAHVPADCLAKGVLLEVGEEYVMAVLPATHRLNPHALGKLLHRDVRMADESDFPLLFRDCRPGAVPPLGAAYGIATVVEDSLLSKREVYFEGGDHEHLVHVTGDAFDRLMLGNMHGSFGWPQ